MRFLEHGPCIPDRLLDARDRGQVVFFCGAGVSRPLFPGFLELAKRTIESLNPPDDAKSRKLFIQAEADPEFGFDRVFSALQREYDAAGVDAEVSNLLRTPPNASVEHHKIVLRLSRSISGNAQIVTTNFDLLFEKAERSLQRHVPPAFPDLANGQTLNGVVYLHGRRTYRQKQDSSRQGFVISSADFGRAYLAEGWATRFAKDLLQQYVIVLLGYSATDPPVRYLLEGLYSIAGKERAGAIYAFDQGTEDDVSERWRDRGVHAISYSESEHHASLWDSLKEWARRADDPDAWRVSIVDLARRGPRVLEPYQRGQVAALVASEVGAKVFADADPPAPAEWLCVFDRRIRLAQPEKRFSKTDRVFDPLVAYGLDDDTVRASPQGGESSEGEILSQNTADEPPFVRKALAGAWQWVPDTLPRRLRDLSRWIGRSLNDPITAWWAAGYPALHPQLREHIAWAIEHSEGALTPRARKVWSLLLEEAEYSPDDDHHRDWYAFRNRLKIDGWTNITLREFERVAQPFLRSTRPLSYGTNPPRRGNRARMGEIVHFEVKFPGPHGGSLDIPADILLPVFRILRHGLEHAVQLSTDIDLPFLKTVTLFPETKPGERSLDDADTYFLWVVELFDRLVGEQPEAARVEVASWPNDDEHFFDRLKLYAWTK